MYTYTIYDNNRKKSTNYIVRKKYKKACWWSARVCVCVCARVYIYYLPQSQAVTRKKC